MLLNCSVNWLARGKKNRQSNGNGKSMQLTRDIFVAKRDTLMVMAKRNGRRSVFKMVQNSLIQTRSLLFFSVFIIFLCQFSDSFSRQKEIPGHH